MRLWNKKEVERSLKELPFYNASIEKTYIKRLNNIYVLHELPFYNELSIVKTSRAFKEYARGYSIEIIIDSKDSSIQLTFSTPSVKDLFKEL